MSTESYVGQQFKVNRKSFTVERIIAEGESSLQAIGASVYGLAAQCRQGRGGWCSRHLVDKASWWRLRTVVRLKASINVCNV